MFGTCQICGTPIGYGTRCSRHPLKRTPQQARGYRGLAGYREFRDAILARDAGICGAPGCGRPGANELGHRTPYAQMDPAIRDDPSRWDPADFVAIHSDCNKRLGATPIP